jgi:hypothetical protein
MSAAPSPVTIQQSVFAAIHALEQDIHAYLATYPTFGGVDDVGNWVQGLDEYSRRLIQVHPSAEWLRQQGLPAASQYLEGMSRNFAEAQQIYAGMYRDKAAVESRISGILTEAGQFALNNISQATQYRDAVFQKWTQGYFDVTENRCFDCHELIGIPGGGYCLKCARRRGIVY